MIGNRKEEGRACAVLLYVNRKSPTPSENRLTAIRNWKKPKSDPGFEPCLPWQNAIALPLVPPPLPSAAGFKKKYWQQEKVWWARTCAAMKMAKSCKSRKIWVRRSQVQNSLPARTLHGGISVTLPLVIWKHNTEVTLIPSEWHL